MTFLQSEQSYIQCLKDLKKSLLYPELQEDLKSFDDIIDLVDQMHSVHETLYKGIISGESDLSDALKKLSSCMELYISYSFLVSIELSNVQKFSDIYSDSGMHIIDLLNEPLAHISKYQSLFENLNSAMPKDEYNEVLKRLETTSDKIKNASALRKNAVRMLQIQKLLKGRQPKILTPERKILKEGFLFVVDNKHSSLKKRVFFLFNDLLLCCKAVSKAFDSHMKDSLIFCAAFSLDACSVNFVIGCPTSEGALFKVTAGNMSYLLLSKVPGESQSWVAAIQEAVGYCQKSPMKLRPRLHQKSAICVKQRVSPFLKRSTQSSEKSHEHENSLSVQPVKNLPEYNFRKSSYRRITKSLTCMNS